MRRMSWRDWRNFKWRRRGLGCDEDLLHWQLSRLGLRDMFPSRLGTSSCEPDGTWLVVVSSTTLEDFFVGGAPLGTES